MPIKTMVLPLAMALTGERRTISSLSGSEEVRQRLGEMGFVPGTELEVTGSNASGIIILVKGTRIALNRGLAQKILVA